MELWIFIEYLILHYSNHKCSSVIQYYRYCTGLSSIANDTTLCTYTNQKSTRQGTGIRDNNFTSITIDHKLQERPERRRRIDNDVRNSGYQNSVIRSTIWSLFCPGVSLPMNKKWVIASLGTRAGLITPSISERWIKKTDRADRAFAVAESREARSHGTISYKWETDNRNL